MRKLIILFLIAFLFIKINAQEYQYVPMPMKNAVWSEMFYYFGSLYNFPNDTMNVKYALFDEDTTIFGETYHKLFMVLDSIPSRNNAVLTIFIREESKTVYYRDLDATAPGEGILYDFNVKVGDNLHFPQGDVPVAKIDTVLIGNTLRKRFYLWWEDSDVIWIEGIGSLRGILHTYTWSLNDYYDLLCLKQNDTLIYYNDKFGTCYPAYPNPYDAIYDKKTTIQLIISPNPVKDILNYQLPENNQGGFIKIISVDGRIQLEKEISTGENKNIIIETLNDGIYLLIYINAEQILYVNKFIKVKE